MKLMAYSTNALINSTFILDDRNLAFFILPEGNEEIDDFKNVFDSVEIKIIWFLTWIIFESFTNANHFFIIMFEKYGG